MQNFKLYTRAIIKNEEWQILLVQKNDKQKIAPWKSLPPWWTVEFWEEIQETLKREVFEEVGLEITKIWKILKTETRIIWHTHWFWVYFEVETKNLDFENKEPEKHSQVYFWNFNM